MKFITNFQQSNSLLYLTIEFEYNKQSKTCYAFLDVLDPRMGIYKRVKLPLRCNPYESPDNSSYRVPTKSFIVRQGPLTELYEPRLYNRYIVKPESTRYCYQSEYDEILYLQTNKGVCHPHDTFYNCEVWSAYTNYMMNELTKCN